MTLKMSPSQKAGCEAKCSWPFLFFVPTLIVFTRIFFRLASGPFWFNTTSDPAYIYLINGLNITVHTPPGHVDHPGTPLQLLIAGVIILLNWGQPLTVMVDHVIKDPEFYLSVTYGVLLVLYWTTAIAVSLYIFKKSKDALAAMVVHIPLFSTLSFYNAVNVAPETVLMSVTNLFTLGLLKILYASSDKEENQAAIWCGFVMGLGTATKLTFLPLGVIPFMLLRTRDKFLLLIFAVFSFVLWTKPIWVHYADMADWFKRLMGFTTGSGGGISDTNGHLYFLDLMNLIRQEWFYAGVVILAPVIAWFTMRQQSPKSAWSIFSIATGIGIEWMVVAKFNKIHYLIVGLQLIGLLMVVLYLWLKQKSPLGQKACALLVFIFFAFNTAVYVDRAIERHRQTLTVEKFYNDLYAQYPQSIFVGWYCSSSKEAALHLGINWGRSEKIAQALTQRYPDSYYWNVWTHHLTDFNGVVFSNDILSKGKRVIFIGPAPNFLEGPFLFRKVGEFQDEEAYELVATIEEQATIAYELAIRSYMQRDIKSALFYAFKSKEWHYLPHQQVDQLIQILSTYH